MTTTGYDNDNDDNDDDNGDDNDNDDDNDDNDVNDDDYDDDGNEVDVDGDGAMGNQVDVDGDGVTGDDNKDDDDGGNDGTMGSGATVYDNNDNFVWQRRQRRQNDGATMTRMTMMATAQRATGYDDNGKVDGGRRRRQRV